MLNNSVLIYGTEEVLTVMITNGMQHITGRKYNVVRSYVGLLVTLAVVKIRGLILLVLTYIDTQVRVC
jgi:hypothetical protein